MDVKVFVYNNDENDMELFYLTDSENMPYAEAGTMTVGEFMGSSTSPTIWTQKATMECWNRLRQTWGQPIFIGYAFKRIWEGGHGYQSQHYAGTAMDMAQNLSNAQRAEIRSIAEASGCWYYVEPGYLTPTWVHVDDRLTPPACAAGYISLRQGSINTYVLILQDALNTLGFIGGGLDGVMGAGTVEALKNYQASRGLGADGVVGCRTWDTITREVRGIGRSETTIL